MSFLAKLRVAIAAVLAVATAVLPGAAQAAGPPSITDTWVSGVGAVVGDLRAEIDTAEATTTYHFSYLTEAAYQANVNAAKDPFAGAARAPLAGTPSIPAASVPQAVLQHVALFQAATTYRYRVVAKNAEGETKGPTKALSTRAATGGSLVLPDNRAWELVSPANKGGGQVDPPESIAGGGVLQAAANGDAFSFSSIASFGDGGGAAPGSQYLATRGSGGWGSDNLTAPLVSAGYPDSGQGVPYRLFSSDLNLGLLSNGQHCRGGASGCMVPNPPPLGSGAVAGYRNFYLRSGGGYEALLSGSSIPALSPADFEVGFAGATPDLSQIVLSTCAALSAEAVEVPDGDGCDEAKPNLYLWSGGGLKALNLLPAQSQSAPGADLAAQSGAISADGSRVYWTLAGNLYLRDGSLTKQVDSSLGGGGTFETASADGSVAYFTKAGHLYRFVAATEALTDLTPGGGVLGVLGASADGTYLYHLTTSGLFLLHGALTKVADGADPSNYPPTTGTARVAPNGKTLAFVSSESITGYDNDGNAEVYRYDAVAEKLICASCNPTGSRPFGPSSIPGALANGEGPEATRAYKPRVLSSDGRRLFFDSADSLVAQDSDERRDVYQWEAQGSGSCQAASGCISLLSGGRRDGGSFLDASVDGSSAFFLTADSLIAKDSGSLDVYVARIGGGFSEAVPPVPCNGDECQGPAPGPEDPLPGTATLRGPGNPPLVFAKEKPQKKPGKRKRGKGKGKKGKTKGSKTNRGGRR